MDSITLQYSTVSAWQSHIIRIMCHSKFSHVDVVMPDGKLLGASDPGGVLSRPPNYETFLIRHRCTIQTDKADLVRQQLTSQIGKPFDDGALHAFLKPESEEIKERDWRNTNSWFCSELVVWAFEAADFFPFKFAFPFNRITPNDSIFLFNPYFDVGAFSLQYTEQL